MDTSTCLFCSTPVAKGRHYCSHGCANRGRAKVQEVTRACACGCGEMVILSRHAQWTGSKGYIMGHWQKQVQYGRGPMARSWKGGVKIKHVKGVARAYVWVPPDHPMRPKTEPYVLRARWVMAESLGRALVSNETVHHINRNTLDDRLENLKLYTSSIEHLREEHFPQPQTHVCAQCGQEFTRNQGYSPVSAHKFCQMDCYNLFRKGKKWGHAFD